MRLWGWLMVALCCATAQAEIPKNVILMIGDGMGVEHVQAGALDKGSPLVFQSWAHQGHVTTHSASSSSAYATDSAAAATAMATGHKVNNGVLSVQDPGDGSPLTTMLELFQSQGKATGLVTNVPMTHATPAAFAAHRISRTDTTGIASDMLTTRPNVMLGSVTPGGINRASAESAGYAVATTAGELVGYAKTGAEYVSGQFGAGHLPYENQLFGDLPRLSEMTTSALQLLQNDDDGFFLMIEGGLIDWSSHANDLSTTVAEVRGFDNSVQAVLDWAGSRDDTLILVTADHETGGLTRNPDGTFSFTTTGHTNLDVPIYAWGANSHLVSGQLDNTDIFRIATVPEPSSWVLIAIALCLVVFVGRRR